MSACRSCGAEIVWKYTENRKRIPLDAEPNPNGNVYFRHGKAVVLGAGEFPVGTTRYMPHHATCPQGKEWKR